MARTRSAALVLLLLATSAAADSGFLTTDDGHRLYWTRAGSGPVTMIVPGAFLLERDFLEPLATLGTVVMYDMRNRARSEFIPDDAALTVQRDVDDLETVRKHFAAARFATLGYSYLGKMVAIYALQHPGRVTRLAQIGPVSMKLGEQLARDAGSDDPVPAELQARLKSMRDDFTIMREPRRYCEEEWKASRLRLVGDPAHANRLGESRCGWYTEWPVNLARHFAASFGSLAELDVTRDQARTLAIPVLTIHGTRDRNAPYEGGRQWAASLPNARMITVSGAAHQAWADDPSVIADVVAFFRGSWPERAERVPSKR